MVADVSADTPLTVFGLTGFRQASGFPFEEWDLEMAGDRGRRNIRAMIDQSAVIGAGLRAFEILNRGVHWETLPANDSSAARQAADLVNDCKDDMDTSWEEFVAEHFDFFPWGWHWAEIEYKLREGPQDELSFQIAHSQNQIGDDALQPSSKFSDGKIGWHRFGVRSQESLLRWEFTRDGRELLGMWQQPAPTYQLLFVPYARSMNFRTVTTRGNPEGRSGLRNCWTSHRSSTRIQALEGIGIERDLAGIPKIGVPPQMLAADAPADQVAARTQWELIGKNLRNDEQAFVLYPLAYDENGNKRTDIELMTTAGSRLFDTDKIIARYEQRILLNLLADFLLLGHEGQGSRALVDPRLNMFALAAQAYLRASAGVINARAIPQLCTLNRIPLELAPRLVPGKIRMSNLIDFGKFVLALQQAQSFAPLAPDVLARLLEEADLPTADTGQTVATQQPNVNAQDVEDAQPNENTAALQATEFPADWPDWAVHEVQDLVKQRPSGVDARAWGRHVLDAATRVMAERANGARVFDMGAR